VHALTVPARGRLSWLETLAHDVTYGADTPIILDLEKPKEPRRLEPPPLLKTAPPK
jgi:hypothetical protein